MQSKHLDVLSGIGMLIKLSRGISLHTFWAMQILKQYKTNLNQFVVTLIIRSLLNFPLMVVTWTEKCLDWCRRMWKSKLERSCWMLEAVVFMWFTTPLGMDVLQRSGMLKLFLQGLDGCWKILLPTVRITQA